ncbi:hypothetical protein V8C86DRAFT_2569300 [Haematococcus lacustris]
MALSAPAVPCSPALAALFPSFTLSCSVQRQVSMVRRRWAEKFAGSRYPASQGTPQNMFQERCMWVQLASPVVSVTCPLGGRSDRSTGLEQLPKGASEPARGQGGAGRPVLTSYEASKVEHVESIMRIIRSAAKRQQDARGGCFAPCVCRTVWLLIIIALGSRFSLLWLYFT